MEDEWDKKIRALEAAGLTLTEISEQTGLSLSSISDLKQGRAKGKSAMAYVRLHDLFLGLPPEKRAA